MYIFVFLCSIFIIYANSFAEEVQYSSEWKKHLHISPKGSKEVLDQHFYFTNGNNIAGEISEFATEINGSNGKEAACAFPGRYLLLKKSVKGTRVINLKKCSLLNEFMDSFKHKHVSLLITSELMNAPASAFGHLLLVLHNENKPELSSDVIHFSAVTNKDDSFLKYAFKGTTGRYPGYYFRGKLFEKLHEYSNVEQRYLYSYELKISEEQKKKLLYHLFELRKSHFDYYFLNQNCGYRITSLLGVVYNKEIKENKLYTLPVETIYEYEDLFTSKTKILPYSAIAKYYTALLSVSDKTLFNLILKGKRVISNADSDILKKSTLYYYIFKFKKEGVVLPHYKKNLLAIKNVKFSMIKNNLRGPLDKQLPRKVQVGLGKKNSKEFYSLRFRPLLVDNEMFQKNNLHESELSIFNTSIFLSKNSVALDEFDLLSVKVMPTSVEYFSDYSWQGNLSINSKNFKDENATNLQVGLGKTYKAYALFTGMINLGVDSNKDFSETYISPELSLIYYASKSIKFQLGSQVKLYQNDIANIIESHATHSLNQNNDIVVKYRNNTDISERFSINFSRYF